MSEFRYLDICAGISASTVAWRGLGWSAATYAEIDSAPRERMPRAFLTEFKHVVIPEKLRTREDADVSGTKSKFWNAHRIGRRLGLADETPSTRATFSDIDRCDADNNYISYRRATSFTYFSAPAHIKPTFEQTHRVTWNAA
jgi:hypothetical protein